MNSKGLWPVLALLLAAPVVGAQQQFGRDSDVWHWDGKVDAGRWMHVFNVNGSVDFLPSNDNMIHLLAEKRTNRGDPDDIHYEVVQEGGNVTICGSATSPPARMSNDSAISVPRSTRIASHPPPKLPIKAVSAVTTSVW